MWPLLPFFHLARWSCSLSKSLLLFLFSYILVWLIFFFFLFLFRSPFSPPPPPAAVLVVVSFLHLSSLSCSHLSSSTHIVIFPFKLGSSSIHPFSVSFSSSPFSVMQLSSSIGSSFSSLFHQYRSSKNGVFARSENGEASSTLRPPSGIQSSAAQNFAKRQMEKQTLYTRHKQYIKNLSLSTRVPAAAVAVVDQLSA